MQNTEDRRACQPPAGYALECEVVGGLEDLAREEVRRMLGDRAAVAVASAACSGSGSAAICGQRWRSGW